MAEARAGVLIQAAYRRFINRREYLDWRAKVWAGKVMAYHRALKMAMLSIRTRLKGRHSARPSAVGSA